MSHNMVFPADMAAQCLDVLGAGMAKYRHLDDFTHRAGTTPVPKY